MNNLLKKFSIAVSFGYINVNELKEIIRDYSPFIHDIYFSPTENIKYQTRYNIYNFHTTDNIQRRNDLYDVISYAKELGIKISMTLNSPMVNENESIACFEEYYKLYNFDYLTTKTNIAKRIKYLYPEVKLICSYNEGIYDYNKLEIAINSKLFFAVVLGNRFLRDKRAFKMLKESNINSILMLNTGCTKGCRSFCNNIGNPNYCKDLFNSISNKMAIEDLYAMQSVFPEELPKYESHNIHIDVFKLASRPITYKEMKLLLESYINIDSKSYIKKSLSNYHLYGRLAHYAPHYYQFDYNKILESKEKLWENMI